MEQQEHSTTMPNTAAIMPAMRALERLRHETNGLGKEGGHKSEKINAWLDCIESTLRQLEPLGNMMKTVNQQSELLVRAYRDLSRVALPPANGDDGTSATKGE